MPGFLVRTLLATAALALGTMISGAASIALFGDLGIPQSEGALPWQIASWLIIAATLVWLGYRSRPRGWPLAFALGLLYFGISIFNSIIEARFFYLISSRQLFAILFMSAVATILFALALALILRGLPEPAGTDPGWLPRATWARVAIGAFAYLVVYFAAGMSIMPFIEDFYAQRQMPRGLHVIAMQLLIRGPVFVALMALLVRMSAAGRRETAVMTGAALSILGGIAMLIVPNPFIPDPTRWAHLVEVGVSNFVYGGFLGWLLTKRVDSATVAADRQE